MVVRCGSTFFFSGAAFLEPSNDKHLGLSIHPQETFEQAQSAWKKQEHGFNAETRSPEKHENLTRSQGMIIGVYIPERMMIYALDATLGYDTDGNCTLMKMG